VSWRVGHLAYLEGFCAMEAKDWARAADTLTRAVGLTPTDARPRLELGMALAMTKRYDEAVAQDRAVIEHTSDACTIATALRHEGYAFFDMGLLESARLAYEKSLEYEPQSPIAAHELKALAGARATRHDHPKEAAAFVPPPARLWMLTKCQTKAE
jgi:Flp pilus assembly protein TadD